MIPRVGVVCEGKTDVCGAIEGRMDMDSAKH